MKGHADPLKTRGIRLKKGCWRAGVLNCKGEEKKEYTRRRGEVKGGLGRWCAYQKKGGERPRGGRGGKGTKTWG